MDLAAGVEMVAAASAAEGSGLGGRKFRLDKRTTVLRVEGVGEKDGDEEKVEDKESTESSGVNLKKLKAFFGSQGVVEEVTWMEVEVEIKPNDGEEIDGKEEETKTKNQKIKNVLLVHCANRGVAERIRVNCRQYDGINLSFHWYYGTVEKSPETATRGVEDVATTNATVVTTDGGGNDDGVAAGSAENRTAMEENVEVNGGGCTGVGGDGKGDKSLYWTEDDDLMVDYDHEEDEEG